MHTILIVDDEPNYQIVLSEILKDEGYEVFTANSGLAGLPIVYSTDLDLVLSDMKMPGMDGIAFLEKIKEYNKELPVILITAYAEVEKAVEAMRLGAFTYLAKPFSNQQLLAGVRKAIEHYGLIREIRRLRDEATPRSGFGGMIGKSPSMRAVYQLIEKVAPTPSSVLITGESGTGKELVARAIHNHSPRRDAPFISVNCAALSEHLLESELFGHEKGAFTDAVVMRKGRFELADTGTLFLDEVGEMPPQLQAKLLRVLQEREVERLGSRKTIPLDVRVIATSNRELRQAVAAGLFREDLFYRLNVFPLRWLPLAQRPGDILPIAEHLVQWHMTQQGGSVPTLTAAAAARLLRHRWPGNVRELDNVIQRALILCDGVQVQEQDLILDEQDWPCEPPMAVEAPLGAEEVADWESAERLPGMERLGNELRQQEHQIILDTLIACQGSRKEVADKLGISPRTLRYKLARMREVGIEVPE